MNEETLERQCPNCGAEMVQEHQHTKCAFCGLIIGCCEGAPL